MSLKYEVASVLERETETKLTLVLLVPDLSARYWSEYTLCNVSVVRVY